MKKSLIALGIAAAAATAAQANTTTLYGRIGFAMDIARTDSVTRVGDVTRAIKNTELDLADAPSARIGIRGTEDLASGMQVFYRFEFSADANGGRDAAFSGSGRGITATRHAHLGFRGDFGTFILGRQGTVWAQTTNFNDIFRSVGYAGSAGGPSRVGKAIAYVSPQFGGFTVAGAAVVDGRSGSRSNIDDNVDAFDVGVLYSNGSISAGLGHLQVKNSVKYTGGHLGYTSDNFQMGIGMQRLGSAGDNNGNFYNLAAQYSQDANTYRVGFDFIDPKVGRDGYNFALGYQYNFSRRTSAWLEGEYSKRAKGANPTAYRAVIGIRHDF